ncbi:lipopolysaccharide assembly protein LapA domain-containing protein [Virgibacillus sp. 179-BFC.A HS]|uniref:Lipopolysaccharide assembly protein LapA domain-containing protein n=1 Tax=Tigheibacillus jepli TaxID=3035914 RepID=A0ABU5CGL6_9BACI|nr:lipopolysaccharide assembly protein LapA domain-containing protein [Virgibacillus sp. 179-BFC.A HS]MDY0405478.1 lipopolysaccharide assembly protein LapA domain-containing protein [Virgibacillus sp. 179-BFC.A HS]
MRGQTYVILSIIFVILIAIFAVTNVSSVEVNYFFWKTESPLILVILFSTLMGVLITAAVGMVRMYRLQRQIKMLRTENHKLQQQLEKHGLLEEHQTNDHS